MSAALDKCRKRCAELERERTTVDQYARRVWAALEQECDPPSDNELVVQAVSEMTDHIWEHAIEADVAFEHIEKLRVLLSDCRQWIGSQPTRQDDVHAVSQLLQTVDQELSRMLPVSKCKHGDEIN